MSDILNFPLEITKFCLSLFKITKIKHRKYLLLSAIFISVSTLGILLGNKAIVAQIRNIYGENSDQIIGLNSLMTAVANNDIGGVRFFSKGGPALVNQQNIGGATALHIASREGNYEIATILIANGADVNVADNEGWTPLMRAALSGSDDIVELFLAKNVDATKLNSVNESAIIHAASSDCTQCLNLMFEKFNFIKLMDSEVLRSQLNDAYTAAKNHENTVMEGILEKYLDQVLKMANLVNPDNGKMVSEDLGDISISQGSRLDLITKNAGEAPVLLNGAMLQKRIKNRFKFVSGDPVASEQSANNKFRVTGDAAKTNVIRTEAKKGRFVFLAGAAAQPQTAESNQNTIATQEDLPVKKFRPNNSQDVFLQNNKINNKSVVEILKSKKFRFSQGAAGVVQDNKNEEEDKKSDAGNVVVKQPQTNPSAQPSNELVPTAAPAVNSFRFLNGPGS